MIYGYIRVSTNKQHVKNQRFEIQNFVDKENLKIDKWIRETVSSTQEFSKRKLAKLIHRLNPGDIIITTEISRLGRNMLQLMDLLHECMKVEAQIWTLKDNYRLGSTLESKILAFAFGLSAEIERNLIAERTREALLRIKKSGRILGRRVGSKNKVNNMRKKADDIINLLGKGLTKTQVAQNLHISRLTLYRYLDEMKKEGMFPSEN